ncbi:TSUP family transporter, partial [Streptococcus pyogenes]
VGIISVFLGIGGGPLNIALLMMLYSYSAKEAAVYSLAMIFFAQLSKIVILGTHLKDYRLNAWLVLGIIIFAFIGGLVGT